MSNTAGRLTPQRQERVIAALRAGNYVETAAQVAGIGRSTFYDWMGRGNAERERVLNGEKPRKAETPYAEFAEAVEMARAEAEAQAVALIRRSAMDGTWQAAAWWLERTGPKKWGRFDRHEVSGPDGAPVALTVTAESLEEKVSRLLEKVS